MKNQLLDQFGRTVNYIRLSITDRCDFRCVYCMSENMTFLPRNEVLSLEESARLVKIFVGLGVSKVRITGGEPLVRKNALWLFEEIGQLDGLKELVVTTNGSQLEKQAHALKSAGVKRINISLDSLNAERFKKITRIGDLNQVLRGIEKAKKVGFENIKLNTVIMRGINDDEILPLVQFAIDQKIDISFIEEMPLGDVNHTRENTFLAMLTRSISLKVTTHYYQARIILAGQHVITNLNMPKQKLALYRHIRIIFVKAATAYASPVRANFIFA